MITYHNRSHIQALMDLYPNLNLQREKFVGVSGMPSLLPLLYPLSFSPFFLEYDWTTRESRRESMDTFARETLKIDPLVAANWYPTKHQDFHRLVSLLSLFFLLPLHPLHIPSPPTDDL